MALNSGVLKQMEEDYKRLVTRFRELVDGIKTLELRSLHETGISDSQFEFTFLGRQYCLRLIYAFDSNGPKACKVLILSKESPDDKKYSGPKDAYLLIDEYGSVYEDDQKWDCQLEAPKDAKQSNVWAIFTRLLDKTITPEIDHDEASSKPEKQ